ncbi:TIR domain-containing protein [Sorangium sp. So ce764]|uniref:TIR domain-containing protein n=1 Tax=Sorangium sp. So ce764 TaxID=3133320 RepID=UPI003F5E22C1
MEANVVEKRQEYRVTLLVAVYEQTGGASNRFADLSAIAKERGIPPEETRLAWSYFLKHGLLEGRSIGTLQVSMTAVGVNYAEEIILKGQEAERAQNSEPDEEDDMATQQPDPKKVFIIHGRNVKARKVVEQFVRSLGLTPIDFEQLAADSGAAFIGEIVRNGLTQAQGIIALFTADEIAHLRPDYHEPHDGQEDKERWQSRPNVIFEAGMAYGMAPERTILAVLGGQAKLFSDVRGMHLTFLSNNRDARKRLRQKLIGAKCDVDQRSDAYDDPAVSGDFDSCVLPEVSTRSPFRD